MVAKKNLLVFMLILFSLSFISAGDVEIIKTSVDKIKFGETASVGLEVKNSGNAQLVGYMIENIFFADAVNPPHFNGGVVEGIDAFAPYYYDWELTIPATSKKVISYEIKPQRPGKFKIGQTKMYVGNDIFYSNELSILVECNQNKICEDNLFENFKNCPEDCSKSQRDDICNLDDDGICDPDCSEGADLDCVEGFEGIENGNKKSGGFSFDFLRKIDMGIFGVIFLILLAGAGIPIAIYYDKKRESNPKKKTAKKSTKKGSSLLSMFSSDSKSKKKEKKSSTKYCGKCGKALHKSDKFCRKCGRKS